MVKQVSNKGFTLLEMLIVLSIVCLFFTITLFHRTSIDEDYYSFSSKYLYLQSEAMRKAEKVSLEDYDIYFNSKGNVNRAQTLSFSNFKKIIVELGGGRLVQEE